MALEQKTRIKLDKAAEATTRWIGSFSSLIIHTILFIISFALSVFHYLTWENMLLILTTIVSLEAIYLSIFIQMTVNRNTQAIEIIQGDVGEIQEDVGEIQEDVGEIQEDVGEIQEDIDEIQKDVDEIQEEDDKDIIIEKKEAAALANIQAILLNLQKEIEVLKKK